MNPAAPARSVYRRVYDFLRHRPWLNFAARKAAGWAWLEDTRLYQYVLWRRISRLVREWEEFPPVVLVGVTTSCNAACIMCPLDRHPLNVLAKETGADGSVPSRADPAAREDAGGVATLAPAASKIERYTKIRWKTGDPRGPGHTWGVMSLELFEKMVRECAAHGVRKIILSGGEPTLDRTLPEKVALAKRIAPGMQVDCFTNGSALTERVAEALVRAGLDNLTISFDGSDQESYEHVRRNLDYRRVVENARRAKEIRDRLGSRTPYLRFDMISLTTNRDMRRQFFRDMKGIVDLTEINNPHNWANTVSEQVFGASPVYGRHVGRTRRYPCYLELYRMTVHWDGTVPVCNYDYYGGGGVLPHVSGYAHDTTLSIKDISLKQAWDDPRYVKFRRLHTDLKAKRWQKTKPCVDCTHHQSWWLEPA